MRICMVLEGSYPFVHGGVSSWMHGVISRTPENEYVLWAIGAHEEDRGKYAYDLPKNVTEVHECFLDTPLRDKESFGGGQRHLGLSDDQLEALGQLVACDDPDWGVLINLFQGGFDARDVLMSEDYLRMVVEVCRERYPHAPFAQVFHTSRSMLLPVLYLLGRPIPQADVYHTVCTGYGGVLASMGHIVTGKPLILSEHGIYSREREEELIRADWVQATFKRRWIRFFYMLSNLCYANSAAITSLFDGARGTQVELGADPARCHVVRNGVNYERFAAVPPKAPEDHVVIGAVIRLAPIKDVKTMIYAFYELSQRLGPDAVELHILGDTDDEEYGQECRDLVTGLDMHNLFFDGHVDTVEYMRTFDFTILSSISEGQPLCVLESLAAGRPAVTTDVGSCRELLEGAPGDTFGRAGIVVPPMDRKSFADAMETMCRNSRLRVQMGEAGKRRVERYYRVDTMMEGYHQVYEDVMSAYAEGRGIGAIRHGGAGGIASSVVGSTEG